MARTGSWYNGGVDAIARGEIHVSSEDVKCALLADTYVPNIDTHTLWSDVSANEVAASGDYVAGGKLLTGKSVEAIPEDGMGVLFADLVSWSGVTITARYRVLYHVTTGKLLHYVDFGANVSATNDHWREASPNGWLQLKIKMDSEVDTFWFRPSLGAFLDGHLPWITGTHRVGLFPAAATFDHLVDAYWQDVSAEQVPFTGGYTDGGLEIANRSITLDAATDSVTLHGDPVAWPNSTITARKHVIWHDTGNPATSRLLLSHDAGSEKSTSLSTFTVQGGANGWARITVAASSQSGSGSLSPGDTLIASGRLTYTGSALLPNIRTDGPAGTITFNIVQNGFVYDSGADNFLLRGKRQKPGFVRDVARFTLPTPVPHTGHPVDNLPRGSQVTEFFDITDGLGTSYTGELGNIEPFYVGGLAIHNGKIIWVQEPHYDQQTGDYPVIGICDNTQDLLNLNGVGPWMIDRYYKAVARYITIIPQAWADAHTGGKRLMMGVAGISGRNGTSSGPALIAVEEPTAATPLDYKLQTQEILFWNDDDWVWPGHWRGWHSSHFLYDIEWIEDGANNWIVMIGTRGLDSTGYKTGYPCGSTSGYWSYPSKLYLMVYHADDLLPIIAGTKAPNEVYPREIAIIHDEMVFTGECAHDNRRYNSLAWDAARKRLWVIEPFGDYVTSSSGRPVAHAYDLDAA